MYLLAGESPQRLVRFDERGAATLPTSAAITDLFEGPNDTVYVRDQAALHRVVTDATGADQLLEVVRFPPEILPVRHLAIGPSDSIWVVTETAIAERTADGWKLAPLAKLELPNTARLAFDVEQTLWAVAPERALYLQDGRWLAPPLELLETGFALLNPLGSPVGRVHVSNNHRLTRLGKQDFESVIIDYKNRVPHVADLDIAPDGYACVATEACDLGCANHTPPTIIWTFPGKDYACDSLHELAVEASHRVWVASQAGLSLVLPDREVHEFSIAEHPELAGPITAMVVVE